MSPATRIIIIGGGPGGYVAAIRGAQLGGAVTLVEHQLLGGICLNWGCIPSKALLSVIELGDKVKRSHELGLTVKGPVTYDLNTMRSRKDKVVGGLVKGVETLLKHWGVTCHQGRGTLIGNRCVRVTNADGAEVIVEGDAIVVATGSSWPDLPLFPVDGTRIITSREALDPVTVPRRLLIIGAGVEGCEFASLYSGLGSKVTLVEFLPRVLPLEDEEISSILARELKKRGVVIRPGVKVETMDSKGDPLTATLTNGEILECDQVLVSVGRGFNTDGLGLDQVGVHLGSRNEISVNDRMETNVPGIYAIGDVTGKAMLAHVASAQGKVAVENILGHPRAIDYRVIPAGIFTLPEIGRVGLTEQQAREWLAEQGKDPGSALRIGRFRYAALGKAHAVGETAGLFKILSERESGHILGTHIIGSHAADLIHEAALAMQVGATAEQVAQMIHAHPTLAEGCMEAAEDLHGQAIHQARKKV